MPTIDSAEVAVGVALPESAEVAVTVADAPAVIGVLVDWADDGGFGEPGDDVTARVLADRGVTIERGRDQLRSFAPPMAGRLTFALDNRSRDYSSHNTGSPLAGQVRPGHAARVVASLSGVTYTLGAGLVDDIAQEPGLGSRSAAFACLGTLSRLAGKRVTTGLYTGITTDVAIGAVLDAVGWPAGARSLQTGRTTLAYWWLEDVDAFAALRTLLNTEGPGAALYERGDGAAVFEDRHYRILTGRSNTSQGTFRDSGGEPWHREPFDLNPGYAGVINHVELPVNIRAPQALAEIWRIDGPVIFAPGATFNLQVKDTAGNPFTGAVVPAAPTDVTVIAGSATFALDRTSGLSATLTVTTGPAGATLTALRLRAQRLAVQSTVRVAETIDASASRAKYGLRTYEEDIWPEIDLRMAQDFANALVGAYQEPRATATITVEAADATMRGHCLAREVSDRVTVVEAQTGLNHDLTIERIRHDLGPIGRHVTTWGLEQVAPGAQPMIFGFGTFGTNVFGW